VSLKKEGEKKEKALESCLKIYNFWVPETVVEFADLTKISHYSHIPGPLTLKNAIDDRHVCSKST
jgi:hypothetical protein